MLLAAVAAAVVLVFVGGPPSGRAQAGPRHWVATWAASPQPPSRRNPVAMRGFDDDTIRQYVLPSVGGSRVRIRLSNLYGTRPLRVGSASIVSDAGAPDGPELSPTRLSFDGRRAVTVAAGATVTSDPASLRVTALRELAISVFLPGRTGPATGHTVAEQLNAVAPGDETLTRHLDAAGTRTTSWFFLDGVSVLALRRVRGSIVALGDSITDGFRSDLDANARWPNDLARRLAGVTGPTLSVVDAGIAGNRLLTSSPCFGPSGVTRFRRDGLGQPAVSVVIVLEGTNDIGMSHDRGRCSAPHTVVPASRIIAGDRRLIAVAHAHHVRIFAGTLPPFRGSRFWTAAGERTRDEVNRWIRTSGAFDGVIDFARVLADPRDRETLDPRYDSGDHLHPDDGGYRAMARAINLATLLGGSA